MTVDALGLALTVGAYAAALTRTRHVDALTESLHFGVVVALLRMAVAVARFALERIVVPRRTPAFLDKAGPTLLAILTARVIATKAVEDATASIELGAGVGVAVALAPSTNMNVLDRVEVLRQVIEKEKNVVFSSFEALDVSIWQRV